jgi:hypothetical protein
MTLKINWGVRITGLYLGFVAIIVTLVVGSARQSFDLVSEDYYQQELAYQDVLDAGKNQTLLSVPVQVHANETILTIDFPAEFQGQMLTGKVHFYSPVNSAWDKVIPINSSSNTMTVNRSDLKNTRYSIKINWTANGKAYYQESEINLYR